MITVGITTCNRANLWRRRLLWDSLAKQTNQNFEVIICDHASTDDTADALRDLRRGHPFKNLRLFRVTQCHPNPYPDATFAPQILFKYAAGEIYLHLEEDGWVHPELIEFIGRLWRHYGPAWYFGRGKFVDPDTFQPVRLGTGFAMDLRRKWPRDQGLHVARVLGRHLWGFLWSAPTADIRAMGGNNLEHAGFRGWDTRLGWRVECAGHRCYFVDLPQMTFHHLGLGWYYRQAAAGNVEPVNREHLVPDFTDPWPVVANGGAACWDSLPIEHVEL